MAIDAVPAPLPVVDDPDTGGFFEAAQRGEVAVKFCVACGRPVHLPGPRCPSCGSTDLEWRAVAPRATVHSFTYVEHAVHPAFPTPYTILLVDLDEVPGVRFLSYVAGRAAVEIGSPATAAFEPTQEGTVILRWTLAS